MRHTHIFATVELVVMLPRWKGDMASGQKKDSLAFATFTEIESTSTLKIGRCFGSDLET